YQNFFSKSREEKLALYSKQEPTTLKQDRFVAEYLGAESKEFKHESILDEKKTLLGNMVTTNNTQEESDRNSSILMDIVSIKPITLLSNYGKNILNDIKNSARKRYSTEQEETTTTINNKLESSQSILVQNE
ncbi:6889_t:CDS:2, partial [Dentiscutata heterogama]